MYILISIKVKKKGVSTPNLKRGDNFILPIYYYLTVPFVENKLFGEALMYTFKTIIHVPDQNTLFALCPTVTLDINSAPNT